MRSASHDARTAPLRGTKRRTREMGQGESDADRSALEPYARGLPAGEPEGDVPTLPFALRPRITPTQFTRYPQKAQGITGYVSMTESPLSAFERFKERLVGSLDAQHGRCWLLHAWTRWSEGRVFEVTDMGLRKGRLLEQTRYCNRCGKMQIRKAEWRV